MQRLTMSMCASKDYLEGYNQAVEDAEKELKKLSIRDGIAYGVLRDAFDDQTRELENALSYLTPEQLTAYRKMTYPPASAAEEMEDATAEKSSPVHPEKGSRWMRNTPHDPSKGDYNGYTVIGITNTAHLHPNHPPQVVYQGDNGHLWSLPLRLWSGRLIPEVRLIGAPQHADI